MLLWLARWLRMGAGRAVRVLGGSLWGRDGTASSWDAETVSSMWAEDAPAASWRADMPGTEWSADADRPEWGREDAGSPWGRDAVLSQWGDGGMPVVKDLTIYPGEDVDIPLTPRDSPATDITGWTIAMYVRRTQRTGNVVFSAAGVITSAAAGLFKIPLSQAQTLRLPGDYWYDIWRTDAGFNRILVTGKLKFGESARFSSEYPAS